MSQNSIFYYNTLDELTDSCVSFYHGNWQELTSVHVRESRSELASFVKTFHSQCKTLTPSVQKKLENLGKGDGIVVMTAHQPNLFPYAGVMRKATMAFVLAKQLEKKLGIPVINLFGIADQDFTDDRWVKSALLPEVERRSGLFELRLSVPEKLMLNHAPRPSELFLDSWKREIENWLDRGMILIKKSALAAWLSKEQESRLQQNFESFWRIVEESQRDTTTLSDFSAYVISKIVNEVWGYDTLFARFSECQQSFLREFSFLLSNFEKYSASVKAASGPSLETEAGVSENEHELAPFWYHCDCGSKARLAMLLREENYIGTGRCLGCGKDYELDLGSSIELKVAGIMHRISARSISMPLIFFNGLGVVCYVGGQGGRNYLLQAKHVAESLGMAFPPVVVWRPKDLYLGISQMAALARFEKVAGTFDLSKADSLKKEMQDRIADVNHELERLESEKNLSHSAGVSNEEISKKMRELSARQAEIRRGARFSELSMGLRLIDNVWRVLNLHPSIIDYAINIGLKETSEQWMNGLKGQKSLSDCYRLNTVFDLGNENVACSSFPFNYRVFLDEPKAP